VYNIGQEGKKVFSEGRKALEMESSESVRRKKSCISSPSSPGY
jgi:hypothetical protein